MDFVYPGSLHRHYSCLLTLRPAKTMSRILRGQGSDVVLGEPGGSPTRAPSLGQREATKPQLMCFCGLPLETNGRHHAVGSVLSVNLQPTSKIRQAHRVRRETNDQALLYEECRWMDCTRGTGCSQMLQSCTPCNAHGGSHGCTVQVGIMQLKHCGQ